MLGLLIGDGLGNRSGGRLPKRGSSRSINSIPHVENQCDSFDHSSPLLISPSRGESRRQL